MKILATATPEEKKHFKEIYKKQEHICVTYARGFWEKAPKQHTLLLLESPHVLINLKDKDIAFALIENPKTEILVSTKSKKPFVMHLEPHFFDTYNEELTYSFN